MRMRRIILSVVLLALPYFSTTTFSHKRHDFRENCCRTENMFCFSLQNFCLKYFSFYEGFRVVPSYMYIVLQSTRYSCLVLTKLVFFTSDFRKILKKFHENPSSGSRVPCRQTDRQTGRSSLTLFALVRPRLKICNKKNSQSVRYLTHNTVSFP